jgi:hypothetical protein
VIRQTMIDPITPSLELLDKWCMDSTLGNWRDIVTQAAQWGADQELEACCEWLVRNYNYPEARNPLRAARRPNPPSLKKQALALVEQHEEGWRPSPKDWDTIRRALEALPND